MEGNERGNGMEEEGKGLGGEGIRRGRKGEVSEGDGENHVLCNSVTLCNSATFCNCVTLCL